MIRSLLRTDCRRPGASLRRARGIALLAAILAAVVPAAGPLDAKVPGQTHCYKSTCHRVKTIAETERLVGRTILEVASYYDSPELDRFNRGRFTSNGEVFDAASDEQVSSSHFPDGTELLLWNPENGRTAHVRVNDFGPFWSDRTLDVTRGVARRLGFLKKGVTPLQVTVIAAPGPDDLGYQRNRQSPRMRGYIDVLSREEVRQLVPRLIEEAGQRHREALLAMAEEVVPLPTRRDGSAAEIEAEPEIEWADVLAPPRGPDASGLALVIPAPSVADPVLIAQWVDRLPLPADLAARGLPMHVPAPPIAMASAEEVASQVPPPTRLAASGLALDVPLAPEIVLAQQLPQPMFLAARGLELHVPPAPDVVLAALPAPRFLADRGLSALVVPSPPVSRSELAGVSLAPLDFARAARGPSLPQPSPVAVATSARKPEVQGAGGAGPAAPRVPTADVRMPTIASLKLSPQVLVATLAAMLLAWLWIAYLAAGRRRIVPVPVSRTPSQTPAVLDAPARDVRGLERRLQHAFADEQVPSALPEPGQPNDQRDADPSRGIAGQPSPLVPVAAEPRSAVSHLHASMRITGQITSQAKLVLMGYVEGEIIGEDVVIEAGARVVGHVSARKLIVRGHVDGHVRAHHVVIEDEGIVQGELAFFTVELAPTARLEAQCRRVGEPTQIATLARPRVLTAA